MQLLVGGPGNRIGIALQLLHMHTQPVVLFLQLIQLLLQRVFLNALVRITPSIRRDRTPRHTPSPAPACSTPPSPRARCHLRERSRGDSVAGATRRWQTPLARCLFPVPHCGALMPYFNNEYRLPTSHSRAHFAGGINLADSANPKATLGAARVCPGLCALSPFLSTHFAILTEAPMRFLFTISVLALAALLWASAAIVQHVRRSRRRRRQLLEETADLAAQQASPGHQLQRALALPRHRARARRVGSRSATLARRPPEPPSMLRSPPAFRVRRPCSNPGHLPWPPLSKPPHALRHRLARSPLIPASANPPRTHPATAGSLAEIAARLAADPPRRRPSATAPHAAPSQPMPPASERSDWALLQQRHGRHHRPRSRACTQTRTYKPSKERHKTA